MEKSLTEIILQVCKTLNAKGVQYLIVGGTAVAFHGYFRWSQNSAGLPTEKFDLDIWYSPTYENYFKLLNALSDLDQDVQSFIDEQSPNPLKSYFKFELEKVTLDFMPKLKGDSNFSEAFLKREIATISKVDIPIIGIDELLEDKAENSRPKDISDIKHLRSIRKK